VIAIRPTQRTQMNQLCVVAFDLDGTLVNTLATIHRTLNLTREFFGFDTVKFEFVKEQVGLPVQELFKDLKINDFELEGCIEKFRYLLPGNLPTPSDVYPGVVELLSKLKKKGYSLAVATSKPTKLAKLTLKAANLELYFEFIVGTDNGLHKPNPWVLNEVKRLSSKSVDFFVGDRIEDAMAAESSGIPFVAILNSIHTRREFENLGCRNIFDSFEDFLASTG